LNCVDLFLELPLYVGMARGPAVVRVAREFPFRRYRPRLAKRYRAGTEPKVRVRQSIDQCPRRILFGLGRPRASKSPREGSGECDGVRNLREHVVVIANQPATE
jgi:hypothetical protein